MSTAQVVTSAESQSVLSELTQISCDLLKDELFFGHLMVRMGRVVTREVRAMAVGLRDGQMTLFINPDFWSGTLADPRHRVGVLKHELLHVTLDHCSRMAGMHPVDGVDMNQLYNIAADLVVNEIVGKRNLPEGALHLDDLNQTLEPHGIWLEPNGTAELYVDQLLRVPRPAQPSLAQAMKVGCDATGTHEMWGAGGTEERSARGELVGAAIRETTVGRGSLPAALQRQLSQEARRRNSIHWRSMLRSFGCSGITTYLKPTIMTPSKRYGTVPGVRVRQRQRLAVAIDTSGSIGQQVLDAFFTEIHRIWRLGVEVTVIECDAAIPEGGVWDYKGRVVREPQGGGGTDFDAPINWANRHQVDGLVYLTDGHGSRTVPSRRRLLWMSTTPLEQFNSGVRFWQPTERVCHLNLDSLQA